MRPSRPRYPGQRLRGNVRFFSHGDVSQRDNANEAFVTIQDRKTTQLLVAHIIGNVFYFLFLIAVPYLFGHNSPNLRIASLALSHATNNDIAVSDHADQAIVLGDRERTGVDLDHLLAADSIVWSG